MSLGFLEIIVNKFSRLTALNGVNEKHQKQSHRYKALKKIFHFSP